jgi:hypothetical protein
MNKQTIILLATFIFCSSAIIGQTNKFDVGLEGGPSLTSLRGNDILEKYNDPTVGFSIGLAFQYNFPKLISIRTNIAFERKGAIAKNKASDEFGNPIGEITTHTNFDYLTIPLFARLTIGNKMKFFVNVGPYFSYLIKQTSKTDAINEFPKSKTDNTSNFTRIDLGLTTGLGAGLPINDKLLITLEIRNNLGLYNISSHPVANDGTIKTNSTNLLFGIAYKFGTRNIE